jgi:vacuolar-type H+-ATPase subunit H
MDNKEILDRILMVENEASNEYEEALTESKQASLVAEGKLQDLLIQVEKDAREEAAQLWEEKREKLDAIKSSGGIDQHMNKKLMKARGQVELTVDAILKSLLKEQED